jgi:hypothetical protein
MPATITSKFRKNNVSRFLDDINTVDHYIGIGKSDPWPNEEAPTAPTSSVRESVEVLRQLKALSKVSNSSYLVPRINWKTGAYYKVYDPTDISSLYPSVIGPNTYNPSYVYHSGAIYVATSVGAGTSTVAPSAGATIGAINAPAVADGYAWTKICNISTVSSLFLTEFVPVSGTNVVATASAGAIYNSKGTLTGSPAVGTVLTIQGDGTGATAEVGAGGTITITAGGSNYRSASILGHTGITLLVAPKDGFGFNAVSDLPAWYAGLAANFSGSETGQIPTTNDFRQVSVVRDPTVTGADDIISTLKGLNFTSIVIPAELVGDAILACATTGAKAYVSHYVVDGATTTVYYHQNTTSAVNTIPFSTSDVVTVSGVSLGTVASLKVNEYTEQTGEVLFIDNRSKITRNENQIEEVRVVVQF